MEEDLTIVDGIKLEVGKKYLMRYAYGEAPWYEVEITRLTPMGHAWGEGKDGNGIRTNGSYFVKPIPYVTYGLSFELQKMQKNVFAFFKPFASESVEMVVERDGNLLKTLWVGNFGGLFTNHVPVEKGIYKEFGDGRSLSDMMSNPTELQEFYKKMK